MSNVTALAVRDATATDLAVIEPAELAAISRDELRDLVTDKSAELAELAELHPAEAAEMADAVDTALNNARKAELARVEAAMMATTDKAERAVLRGNRRYLSADRCPWVDLSKMPNIPDSRGRYPDQDFYQAPIQEAWSRRRCAESLDEHARKYGITWAPRGHCWGYEALDNGSPDDMITWWPHDQAGARELNCYGPMKRSEMKAMTGEMENRGRQVNREQQAILDAMAAEPERPAIDPAERKAIEAGRRQEADELRRMRRMGLAAIPGNGSLESHLLWLYTEFGDREFNTTKVRNVALENPDYRKPPAYATTARPADQDYTKQLGLAWAKVAGIVAGNMWLEQSAGRTAGAWRWHLVVKDGPDPREE